LGKTTIKIGRNYHKNQKNAIFWNRPLIYFQKILRLPKIAVFEKISDVITYDLYIEIEKWPTQLFCVLRIL